MSGPDLLPIQHDEEQERIADLVPNLKHPDQFKKGIHDISLWFEAQLRVQGTSPNCGPIKSEVRAETRSDLLGLSKKLDAASEAMRSLKGFAKQDMRFWARNRGLVKGRNGEAALLDLANNLDTVKSWADVAASKYAGRDNRPPTQPAQDAVWQLAELWEQTTGNRPTRRTGTTTSRKVDEGQAYGPFYEVCCSVITPVYEANGRNPPHIDNLIRKYQKGYKELDYGNDPRDSL